MSSTMNPEPAREMQEPTGIDNQQNDGGELTKEDLRRLMYERIARGGALAEVEFHSNRRWRNK